MSKMRMGIRSGISTFFILLSIFSITIAQPANAISDKLKNLFSQNSIFFYDPDGCSGSTTISGGGGGSFSGTEVWNGNCSSMSTNRISWLNKVLSSLQSVASKNGIPWELIAGQTFQESGGGASEACDYNPLGLKAKSGHAACSNGFAKFSSYNEAFQYYIDSIIPIKKIKNMFPNDPYSAISYIQYGSSPAYASCDSESYSQCVGHMGEPTPGYVQGVSSIICGIQKWAQSVGKAISSVTWADYSGGGSSSSAGGSTGSNNTVSSGARYCNNGQYTDNNYDPPQAGNLVDFIKKWAWPNYEKDKTTKMPAYADYIEHNATYKGGCNGVDCGAFVANIIKASGWDTSYPQGDTSTQSRWLSTHWQQVPSTSLKLGDVGITTGHVILYVGSISGFNSNTASASLCDRAPMAGADKNLAKYTWYRKR